MEELGMRGQERKEEKTRSRDDGWRVRDRRKADRKSRRDVKVENSFHDCPWSLSILSIQVPNAI
jgi:hypothetical protein